MPLRYSSGVRRLATFVLPGLLLLAAAPARAQSPSDIDTARAAFLKGIELRNHHDVTGAIERFRAAYALVPTPRIGFELGSTLRETGDLVGARDAFIAAVNLPPRPNETPEAKKARVDAQAQADDLARRIPQLMFHVVGTGQIYVDGEAIRHEALIVPRRVNPGTHTVQLQVDGDVKSEKSITLREGEHRDVTMSAGVEARVTITAGPTPAAPPPTVVEQQPTQPYDPFATPVTNRVHSNAGTKAALFYAAWTLGGLGVAPGLVALGYLKAAQDACTTDGACDSSYDQKKQFAYGFAIAADVLWGAAVICLITAIAYPSTSALERGQLSFGVSPTAGGGAFSLRGTF